MKILILYESLVSGGVEKSIINFLETIDYSKNEVDLFLNHPHGMFMDQIPKEVNLLNKISTTQEQHQVEVSAGQKTSRLRHVLNSRFFIKLGVRNLYYWWKFRHLKFEKEYDIMYKDYCLRGKECLKRCSRRYISSKVKEEIMRNNKLLKLACALVLSVVMIAASILSGIFTGLCAQVVLNRGDKLWKTIFR